jgi:hypothetical protein
VLKRISLILVLLFCFQAKAQFLDSLNIVFKSKSIIDARLESRYSFIRNTLISVTGVRLGVAYKRKLRIGGGISWLKTNRDYSFYSKNSNGELIETKKYLKFAYLCYYIDFVYYRTKRWQLSVPIQAGTGLAWFQKEKAYSLNNGDRKNFILLYEPGITVQFKAFRYLGVGGDAAFRFLLNRSKKIGEQLNSPTLSIKVLFWPDQLFYVVAPKSKITKLYGPAEW